jgi:hypothetical protein
VGPERSSTTPAPKTKPPNSEAFASDPAGPALPPTAISPATAKLELMRLLRQYGPWTTFEAIELPHDESHQGVDVSVCLDDIGKHGFHLTDAHKAHSLIFWLCSAAHERARVVLGGGGASGHAWAIGVIAGLFDAGLDVTHADLIVGTSAGSTVAAQITGTTRPTELLAAIRTPIWQPDTRGCWYCHHSAEDHGTRGTGALISQRRPMNYVHTAAGSKPSSRTATLKTHSALASA